MNLADKMLDETIRHQIGVEGYKRRVVGIILKRVQDLHDKVALKLLKKDLQSLGVRELGRLMKEIDRLIETGYAPILKLIASEVTAFGAFEAGFQKDLFKSTLPVVFDIDTTSTQQIFAAAKARPFNGFLLKDWLTDMPAKAKSSVRRAIREGYTDGITTQQIVRTISGTRTTTGVATISRRKAEATVRTAITHMASVANEEFARANTKLIDRVQWISTLDGRTSAICISRDGKTWPVGQGPRPPAHINCRSRMLNIPKSWKQLGIDLKEAPPGTRASMNGQVPADINYPEWLKKQPAAFQDGVLGKTKGKLFRNGMNVDKFVSRSGSEKTLDQLKAANAEAFAKL